MMTPPMVDRINLLLRSGRFSEARSFLENHLEQYPNDTYGKYCYALVLFQGGENDRSRALVEELLIEDPTNADIIDLSINIDIDDQNLQTAESKCELLIELNPEDADAHLTLARIKLAEKNYDRSLAAVNTSLKLDPENIEALNLKIMLDGLLGNATTVDSIATALELDAENPSSIANHGIQLLREGKVDESLERLQYALSLNPNNMLAQHGMQEAIKSRFWPYRMFFKYKEFFAKLTAGGSWKILIGGYIGLRALRYVAESNPSLEPFLMPLVYTIVGLFLLTWIMDPLMNLYLLTNKYGKILLDENEKKMAQLCGLSFSGLIVSLGVWLGMGMEKGMFMALVFGLSLIPLGSFLAPTKPNNRKLLKIYTIVLISAGWIGGFLNIPTLIIGFFIGVFIYQWLINGILIKENARVMD